MRNKLAITAVALLLPVAIGWLASCLYFQAREPSLAFSAEQLAAPLAVWPAGFLWGTATSAHQVEGGNDNDWTRFEQQPGRIARGERSGRAVDHWNRMAEDVALMAELRANAYRFSIEWSRVEPRDGVWDETAWARYGQLLQLLRTARVTPMVTLLHFTLPVWIAERGGVTAMEFPERFARFAGEAARRFGPDVELWCLINEPNVQTYLGYVEGVWPPGLRDKRLATLSAGGLLRAYARAAVAVRAQDPGSKVGAAVNLVRFEPARRWSAPDWFAAGAAADTFNWGFYDAIRAGRVRFRSPGFPTLDEPMAELLGSADFVGVNYYRRELLSFSPRNPALVSMQPGPGPKTDLGWETHPEGLLLLLREAWRRYRLPIYITENGLADAGGRARGAYIRAHAYATQRALAEGVPVRGSFHWSLMDNFEWAEGFAPRFGLLRVDHATLARTPAGGADVFAALAPAQPVP